MSFLRIRKQSILFLALSTVFVFGVSSRVLFAATADKAPTAEQSQDKNQTQDKDKPADKSSGNDKAQEKTGDDGDNESGPGDTGSWRGLVPCGTSAYPEVCTLCHLVLGVQGVIQWGLKVMTYIALAVITAMGILYIVSGVDTDLVKTAKGGIKASLLGFTLMLGGWVIINFIITSLAPSLGAEKGGNWYTFTCSTKSKTGGGAYSSVESGGTAAVPSYGGGALSCTNGACAANQEIINAAKSQSYMNPNEYIAILQAGEHYGQTKTCVKGTSSAGACGYAQVMPATARGVCGYSCDEIRADVNKDIACGAKTAADFKKYTNTKCVSDPSKRIDCTSDGIKSLAGCYNRGFKCNIKPVQASNGKWYDCGEIQSGKFYCDRVSEYVATCK